MINPRYQEIINKYNQIKVCRAELLQLHSNLVGNSIATDFERLTHFTRILSKYDAAIVNLNHMAAELLNKAQYERFQKVIHLLKVG